MTKRAKRLKKMRRNPKNVRTDELDSILKDFDFAPDFTSGSHVTYRHPSGVRVTVAAHGAQVPAYIVKQAIKAIDSIEMSEEDEENEENGDE